MGFKALERYVSVANEFGHNGGVEHRRFMPAPAGWFLAHLLSLQTLPKLGGLKADFRLSMSQVIRPKVLVIDDDHDFHALIDFYLQEQGCETVSLDSPTKFFQLESTADIGLVLLDWQLGEADGTALIEPLRMKLPHAPIFFVTAHSTPEVAAASIKLGAFDFLTKPIDQAKFSVAVAKGLEHHRLLRRLNKLETGEGEEDSSFEGLIGGSPQMKTVYSTIKNVAPTDVSVMICGESGTGKELVANAIHLQSDRSNARFVPINMATIPAELAESTLFGHEKGAFTGADKQRKGAVAEAAGGTLFLDEITEMPIELQSKLLRFLQERVFRPVGGEKDIAANVRIVSATNRDPLQAVKDNFLREDLYYRLNVVPINLPPLREREKDVLLLSMHALQTFSQEYRKQFKKISPAAVEILEGFHWPGNVRQLLHSIQRSVVLHDGEVLESSMLSEELLGPNATGEVARLEMADGEPKLEVAGSSSVLGKNSLATRETHPDLAPTQPKAESEEIIPLEDLERDAIRRALQICNGSAYVAADKLGISVATMYRRIKRYGLESAAENNS